MMQGAPETWRHVVAISNPTHTGIFFYQLRFKNNSFISQRHLVCEKTQNLYHCFHNYSLGEAG